MPAKMVNEGLDEREIDWVELQSRGCIVKWKRQSSGKKEETQENAEEGE